MLTPHSRLTGPEQGEQASLKENTSVSGSTLGNRKFRKSNREKIPTGLDLLLLTAQEIKDFAIPEVQVLIEACICGLGTLPCVEKCMDKGKLWPSNKLYNLGITPVFSQSFVNYVRNESQF